MDIIKELSRLSARCAIVGMMALSAIAQTYAMVEGRHVVTVNDGWTFQKSGDTHWQQVNIPHTYNQDAYQGRQYYQGEAIYRRQLTIDTLDAKRRYFLKFEAASKHAKVMVNGIAAGEHAGGYTAFTLDVTQHIRQGENDIEVIVDNSRQDIAPISADFTFWGGIYRDVWLISTPLQHMELTDHGSPGVFVSTPSASEKEAKFQIRAKVRNDDTRSAKLTVRTEIIAPDGKVSQSAQQQVRVDAGKTQEVTLLTPTISAPKLWSPAAPNLYTVVTSIIDSKSGATLDTYSCKSGIRWWHFDPDNGFSLNGKPMKIRGFNLHQDKWPVGVARSDESLRRDIRLIKETGANFLRLSHYPYDNAILEECDRLGLMVWEEISIINFVPKTEGYADNCEANLVDMIRQHYNHPSVIAWGYMNEILLTAPNKSNPDFGPCRERTVELAKRMESRLKAEDPSRTSVMAFAGSNEYNEIGLDLEDVAGWNLYFGWYWKGLDGFQEWCADQHERYPKHPFMISEWGAGSDRRIHSYDAKAFDFSIEYQHTYVEHYLPFIESTPYVMGGVYWNFIDFNVAQRQESMPRVNNKGIYYNDRTPKDVAYYFKATWRKDIPIMHIATNDWNVRPSTADNKHKIKVYSNMPEVELLVNGKSVGKQLASNSHVVFHTELPESSSQLEAKGIFNGKEVSDYATITIEPKPDIAAGEELAINVGSNCHYTSTESDLTWIADRPYEPGSFGYIGGKSETSIAEVFATDDVPLLQSWREGDYTYRFDLPAGTYEVELVMTERTTASVQLANLLGRGKDERYSLGSRRKTVVRNDGDHITVRPTDTGSANKHIAAIKIRLISAATSTR